MQQENAPERDGQLNDSAPSAEKKHHSPLWLRIVKWCLGIAVSLVILLFLGVGVAVWILTPERLTPLVEKYGSDYLIGELKVKRVELTYWSSFPRLLLDVDSLEIISGSLDGMNEAERARLPRGWRRPVKIGGFHGSINILKLLTGEIALRDVVIERPEVMLVDVRPGLSNYNVFPPSEEPSEGPSEIPDISFRRFEIRGETPIRYISLADSIDVRLMLSQTSLSGTGAPTYRLDMGADGAAMMGTTRLEGLHLGAGGDIVWNHKKPYKVTLRGFHAGINDINTVTDATVDFEKNLTVEAFDIEMPRVPINSIISLIPKDMRGEIAKVTNTLQVGVSARLTAPYVPAAQSIPSLDFTVDVPQGTLSYDNLSLTALALKLSGHLDGAALDRSVVRLGNLYANGEGVTVSLSGTATDVLNDPRIEGKFKGGVEFSRLPSIVTQMLGMSVTGHFTADATFEGRQSYLTRENFHRLKLKGDATLSDFRLSMPSESLTFYTRRADLALGTADSFVRGAVAVDSLLTLSLKVDTLAAFMPGIEATGSAIRMGAGIRNTSQSADTTLITPLGAVMSIGRLNLMSVGDPVTIIETGEDIPGDTLRLRLRDLRARASVKRFRDKARVPVMSLDIDAHRIRYADRLNRASLRNPNVTLTLHPQPPRVSPRMQHAIDSLRPLYPNLPPDSLFRMARRMTPRRQHTARNDSTERIDFGLDNDTRGLLRRWNASGHIKAERARVMTPYFPLRNVLRNVDVRFNNDSIVITNTRYEGGHSDFTVNGTISNIQRALTSRSGRQPLRVNLRVTSDTIDVNELSAAAFAGAAFAEREASGHHTVIADTDNDDTVQQSVEAAADQAKTGPLLIPTNIEATVRLNARYLVYEDFLFNTFRGTAEVYDGALNLRNLTARTDVGGIDLTALYQGLHPDSLSFAFGLQVRDFHVGRFMQLIPSLDTVMPLLHDIDGIINGQVAASSALDRMMNLCIPTLDAAISLEGDSLVLLDAETFRKIGKWLLFRNKDRNVIDHMSVKLVVHNSMMELYPFIFDMDRYRLGVSGTNDMALNFKYHVAVLKSPIPFRFGINVSGNPDKMKIRLGRAKFNENNVGTVVALSDTTRINLINQIENIFRRGAARARQGVHVNTSAPQHRRIDLNDETGDTISHADSLIFIQQGLIPAPDTTRRQ